MSIFCWITWIKKPHFNTIPPVGSDFQYRQLIFDSGTVIHGDHTLTIHLSTDVLSVLLLDYLVYTVPDATTSSLVRPTDSVTAGDSTSTTSGTTTKSQGTQATSISTSSSSVEQTTPPSVQSTSTLSSHSTFSSSMSAAGSSAQSSGAGSPDVHSPSNTQSGLPSGNSALTSNLTPISTTSDAHAEPIATNESTGPPTNSIPATTVIAAAVGGSLAVLILLGAVIYLLCIRHARRHFATGGRNHAESPEDDDQPRFVELTQELYPSLATQARLLGHTRNPFADPGVQQSPHANMDTAEVSNLSRSIPANSAYSHAPPDDLESPPMSRSSIQGVITARTSSIISLSAPARPDSPPTTLVDHSHLGASDKLSVAGGTESDDDSGGPCSAPASTLSEVPLRPVPASVDTAPPLNALNHNSWLAADARVLEQLAALKDEVARIRARQEALPAEAPPRYDEVR
ncbi:hypothetical protein ONZ51_g8466 [Trametes cubensis]|uniref:Uncharacterized protein n=1 Tax=Trametes cubensis TaxID=1111947 RepID=A0AAD7TN61_9APHY|nr:hypothetical protein ONZ51_g8466 [Trametes cubensis]